MEADNTGCLGDPGGWWRIDLIRRSNIFGGGLESIGHGVESGREPSVVRLLGRETRETRDTR
jgi:hypothetical protein